MSKTAGEQLFEEYMSSVTLKWDYEVVAGGKAPDYVVHHSKSDVVCEVKDIEPGDIEERVRRSAGMVGVDNYPRIREKINIARRQLQPHKGKLPCVLVLYNAGAMVPLLNDVVAGAMFGDLGFTFAVGDPDSLKAEFVGRARAKLRARQNTTFSAVAVLERFRPNQKMFDSLAAQRLPKPTFEEITEDLVKQALEVFDDIRAEHPEVDFDAVAVRLRVIHNPYAALPLPPEIFSGPYDEHWQPNV